MHRLMGAVLSLLLSSLSVFAQTETATLSGRVTDAHGAAVVGSEVTATNTDTNVVNTTKTNSAGIFFFPSLPPGPYRLTVQAQGFATSVRAGLVLHVQDRIEQNLSLQVGSVDQRVTVTAETPLLNTQDATVSTVVDRQFVENLPLNGRSFQTLIQLTPGVVLTTTSGFSDPGQFSVNGQRSSTNYFMVDGVSANIGTSPFSSLSQTAGGSIPGVSVLGGTNNLVSEDALQEFRIQTSTYAAEFGRTPGAQVSIVTRSGTNDFHGALFEFFRNDKLDANDWFANQKGLPKAPERINDFGGVIGGPILKDRAFFFVSYEGLRLRLPRTGISSVPDMNARASAPSTIQPFLNAYPLPNGPDLGVGRAEFDATFSDSSTLNATSIRVDQVVNRHLTLFGRYNHAPSTLNQRGLSINSLNTLSESAFKTQTLTIGATSAITAFLSNDFRFNYSRNRASNVNRLDSLGGAVVPPDSLLFPDPFSSSNANYSFRILSLQGAAWSPGKSASNVQRQLNFVDSVSLVSGAHSVKFGADYRRLTPIFGPADYVVAVAFLNVGSAVSGSPFFVAVQANEGSTLLFQDLGVFAQDTWRVSPRFTITYGLRWDVDFAPSSLDGPGLLAVTGFDNPSMLALASQGTPLFRTKYNNFAPRVGFALGLQQAEGRETILRGGVGVFYDLSTQQVGDAVQAGVFPIGAQRFSFGGTFPLPPAATEPPESSATSLSSSGFTAFDPNLKLPYVLQWNVALEQSIGNNQMVSASYVAAVGRRLIQPEQVLSPNPNFAIVTLVSNNATSDYHSFQLQFQRRLAHGLQALASYTWSHSIDTASSSSAVPANFSVSGLDPNANRGPSDFDVRHAFSAALSYQIPARPSPKWLRMILEDWSIQNVIQARTATPVNVVDGQFFSFGGNVASIRPDVVPGVPLFWFDTQLPGGKAINPAAFTHPPVDRQGTLGRNALRGFGAAQWDFAIRRQFALTERLNLQFRTEFFNVLNHPNFANPQNILGRPFFGQSITMLNRSVGATAPGAGFAPIFQIGGPRSIQLALRLQF